MNNKKKKSLTMTWINNNNYGSSLQAYALQKYILSLGIENEIVDYNLTSFERIRNLIKSKNSYKLFYYKLKGKISKISAKRNKIDLSKKNDRFIDFKRNELKTTCLINKSKDLKRFSGVYDYYICGSDQIWNPDLLNPAFFFNFINDNEKKISYAASFGKNYIDKKKINVIKNLLSSFDSISVREQSGVDIINDLNIFNDSVSVTCDPTLLLDDNDWNLLLKSSKKYSFKNKYLLCYFLKENPNYWLNAHLLSKKLGFDIVIIPNSSDSFKQDGIVLNDIGPREFVSLFKNSSFVLTDSYHGILFSLIFNKDFFAFKRFFDKDKNSQNSRVDFILNKFNLNNRLFNYNEIINIDDSNLKIEYSIVNKLLNNYVQFSKAYLQYALDKTDICEYCTSCRCCELSCPRNAITMVHDIEGFLKPKIDFNKCIHCNICVEKCPQNRNNFFENYGKAYAARLKDKSLLKESTSGGMFSALAYSVLSKGGVVFGTTLNEQNEAFVVEVDNIDSLNLIRGSKYVTSDVGYSFQRVKELLLDGKMVLYSGVPCQIAGLRSFLMKDYDNLYLVDLICHGSPSNKLFSKYIEYEETKHHKKVTKFVFRDKSKGWGVYWKIHFGRKSKTGGLYDNPYISCFINGNANKYSCYFCKYKGFGHRPGDITLGDYWGIDNVHPMFASSDGCSAVIVNSKKAEQLVTDSLVYCDYILSSKENIANNNPSLVSNDIVPHERNQIYNNINRPGYYYVKHNLKINLFAYIKTKIRLLIPYNLRVKIKKLVK